MVTETRLRASSCSLPAECCHPGKHTTALVSAVLLEVSHIYMADLSVQPFQKVS